MKIEPVILAGNYVSLEPLRIDHIPTLFEAGSDESIWHWSPSIIANIDDMTRYVNTALDDQSRGLALPFVTMEKVSGKIVGSTRFGNIDTLNRKVEIGWTWITPKWQRTVVNSEAKLLMLTHAFEVWDCIRVELKTNARNERSRAAMTRIGATEEGTLRNHMIEESGRFRDSVFFSIIKGEWPVVREKLEEKIGSY